MKSTGKPFCRLVFLQDGVQRVHALGEEPVVLGRSSGCDIVLSHESVSRRHAQVTYKDGLWILTDLNSKNGVRVNTYRVSQQALADGDRIDIGAARITAEIGSDSAVAEANVVFEESTRPGRLHTEVIEMTGLRSGRFASSDTYEASDPDATRMDPVQQEPHTLQLLVREAAEVLLSCDSLDETLERILALVFDKLPVERGVICLYDAETNTAQPKVMRTRDGAPDDPVTISTKIVDEVIEHQRALLVQDTAMDERFVSAESIVAMEIHSAMCAPLYHDRVVGFIYVDRQSDRSRFTASHLQALSTLAALSAVGVEQASLRDEIRREQEIRAHLARYSSPAVVDQIIREPEIAQHMVAEEGEVTVLFADLTGFTSMSERMRPSEVVQMLNRVFERLTDAIFTYEGTLDKFRGDGLMAFFGAPLKMPNHAALAVESALLMQECLDQINAESPEHAQLRMRIGINSGVVTVGDIGSTRRRDYTVIGDVVNTASRLESFVARPGQVVIGPDTYAQLEDRFLCEPLEEVQLKGKRHLVRPYLVRGPRSE